MFQLLLVVKQAEAEAETEKVKTGHLKEYQYWISVCVSYSKQEVMGLNRNW